MPMIIYWGGAALLAGLGITAAGVGLGNATKEASNATLKIAVAAVAAYYIYTKVK